MIGQCGAILYFKSHMEIVFDLLNKLLHSFVDTLKDEI